jgi:membrane-bound inhibitor of C-type lysozyme
MRIRLLVGGVVATGLAAAGSMAAPSMQPPMNDFNQAFYICQNNTAFIVSYDSTTPETATLTTSSNNKTYSLKRDQVAAAGVRFSGDAIKLWTDGKTVQLEGTATHFEDCKLKHG